LRNLLLMGALVGVNVLGVKKGDRKWDLVEPRSFGSWAFHCP
jgi:hypothetical protein